MAHRLLEPRGQMGLCSYAVRIPCHATLLLRSCKSLMVLVCVDLCMLTYKQNVSSLTAQAKQFPLKKPGGFHWDFFLLGCTTFISGIIGIPLPNGLVPQVVFVHLLGVGTYPCLGTSTYGLIDCVRDRT